MNPLLSLIPSIRNHTESKPHKCPHCTKSFANSSYLAQHMRIHTGVKPYSCSFCQKNFRQLSHLQQHNRLVNHLDWVSVAICGQMKKKTKNFCL